MKSIPLRTVLQTTDYDMFVMHDQNRVIVDQGGFKPRKDLINSMKQDGFLETGHIVCLLKKDGALEIIEGHNRFVSAKHLGLPIWFTAHPDGCKATPLKHSKTIKPWASRDFASAHAQDSGDYAEVMAYQRKTGIPPLACFALYLGITAGSSGNLNDVMKAGAFQIKDRVLPNSVRLILDAIKQHSGLATSKNLVNAISRAIFAEGFDVNRMVERINKRPELIKKCNQVSDYEEMLELIYKHAIKSERLHLRVEIEKAMRKRLAVNRNKLH